jgi:hypothetical protein
MEMTPSFKRRKSIPIFFKGYFLNSNFNYEINSNSSEDIKINVFYYCIDCFMTNLKDRFSNYCCKVLKGVSTCHLKSKNFMNYEKMIDFAHHYSIDVISLKENTITAEYLFNKYN